MIAAFYSFFFRFPNFFDFLNKEADFLASLFSLCGITSAAAPTEYLKYLEWLTNKHHAGMAYLDTPYHKEMRKDPAAFFPGLRSIIVLGLPYALTSTNQMKDPQVCLISGYAAGEDYHLRIPRMLESLVDFLTSTCPVTTRPRVYTDGAPILEREMAVRAGLGWIGRNSCVISPANGSGFLLAEIFTDIPLAADQPFSSEHCGTCTRCVDACPTQCILPDRTVDANRCLSYHSIENRGTIPLEIMERFGNQVFGCDICQAICPWNHRAASRVGNTAPQNSLSIEKMLEVLTLSTDQFSARFRNTALVRTKRNGFLRNIIIGLTNLQVKESREPIEQLLRSETDPMIRYTADWALEHIPQNE
jgi:epoxyqueuosine reductase